MRNRHRIDRNLVHPMWRNRLQTGLQGDSFFTLFVLVTTSDGQDSYHCNYEFHKRTRIVPLTVRQLRNF